jgi:endonuclease G
MGLEALERAEALMSRSPGLRAKVVELAHAGKLPNQHLLRMSVQQLEAVAEGKRDQVSADLAHIESTGAADRAMLAYEAIVRQVGRPSLVVQDGKLVWNANTDGFPADLRDCLPHIEGVVGRVGRVELINHRMEWAGTGWMVEPGIVITNRHVAELFAGRRDTRGFDFLVNPGIGVTYGARLDFRQEYERVATLRAEVASVRYIAGPGEPDVALLKLVNRHGQPDPIELAAGEAAKELLVGIIGYPAYDSRNNDQDIAHYFGDIFNKKRFAPGFVTQAPDGSARLMHDCTTLGGNSGSVLIDLSSGRAVGLHFAGSYLEGNFAVSVAQIKSALRGERTVASLAKEAAEVERPDDEHTAEYFAGREGYCERFLSEGEDLDEAAPRAQLVVPLPSLERAVLNDAAKIKGNDGLDTHIIPYLHFSVVFSMSRRVPRFTAVNIDGSRARKLKRTNDQWFHDLRLPRQLQLGREDYSQRGIDRGQMVQREDPNWGDAAEAARANEDTFHYTNAAPQHPRLNRGKQAWLGLEEYILCNARTLGFRAVVFTGPILRRNDPVLENSDMRIPREFWKIIVMVDADKRALHATGYVIGQGELIRDITEGFLFEDFRTYQVRIVDIQRATRLDFGLLMNADPLARRARDEEGTGGLLLSLALDTAADAYLG